MKAMLKWSTNFILQTILIMYIVNYFICFKIVMKDAYNSLHVLVFSYLLWRDIIAKTTEGTEDFRISKVYKKFPLTQKR